MIINAKCPHDISNKPNTPMRIKVWQLVRKDAFDYVIMTVIVLNMI